MRGEGDAERNRIFADAYGRDQEFFSFYRSMQAYAKSMATDGTTLVLNPNSDFFKYFGKQTSAPPAPDQPVQAAPAPVQPAQPAPAQPVQ